VSERGVWEVKVAKKEEAGMFQWIKMNGWWLRESEWT